MRGRNSSYILEGLHKGGDDDRDWIKLDEEVEVDEKKKCKKKKVEGEEIKIDEVKVYDVKAMSKFVGNIISNKFNMLDVVFNEVKADGNDFFISISFDSKIELDSGFENKVAQELANNYLIPMSATGTGFTANIIKQAPKDDGYRITLELYN
jgi:hypothetical protein